MKINLNNLKNVEAFMEVVDKCVGKVELITAEGDRLNLKSKLSQFVSLSKILGNTDTKIPGLEIIAYEMEDTHRIFEYLVNGKIN